MSKICKRRRRKSRRRNK